MLLLPIALVAAGFVSTGGMLGRYSFFIMAFHFIGFKLLTEILVFDGEFSQSNLMDFPIPETSPMLI